jgi:DnaJ domain
MTHYEEFGVSPTASLEEIQRAHRNLARLLHPDLIQDQELRRVAERQLQRLNVIYSILLDPDRRRSYDSQLIAKPRSVQEMALRRATRRWVQWRAPLSWGLLSLGIGFQTAFWWAESHPADPPVLPAERTQTGPLVRPRTAATAAPQPTTSASREDLERLAAETRELRRVLNQVVLERDAAVARFTALRSAPAIPAVSIPAPPPKSPASVEGADDQRPPTAAGSSGPAAADTEPARLTRPNLSGTWIYSAPGGRTSPSDRYPAEYIELLLADRDTLLWGRYRARYKVPDRALSPEVEFFFEGSKADQDRRFTWRGNGGAAGEVHLKLLSENTLSLDWFTSRLGPNLTLGSGTAVLVRRRQD